MLKSAKDIEDRCNINPTEAKFFRLCFVYLDKKKAYIETHPNVDPNNSNSVSSCATRLYNSIVSKFGGSLNDMMEVAGLGENRLVKEIQKGLRAKITKHTAKGEKIGVFEDNTTRARTRELLAKVLIGDKKTVEVTTKQESSLDLSKLSDEELKTFKSLVDKAKPEEAQ